MRYKVAIRFVIDGDVRFISHHDTMRMFERSLLRAGLPVRFSEGFNPRPRLSLPLPRAVGIATEVDVLVIELTEEVSPDEVLTRLAGQMPAGVALKEARCVEARRTLHPESVTYVLDLPSDVAVAVADRLREIVAAETWPIERHRAEGKAGKTVDLRAYLRDARIDEGTLRWTALVPQSGTVRPAEVLATVGLDPRRWHHRLRRIAVEWQGDSPVQSCPNAPGKTEG